MAGAAPAAGSKSRVASRESLLGGLNLTPDRGHGLDRHLGVQHFFVANNNFGFFAKPPREREHDERETSVQLLGVELNADHI